VKARANGRNAGPRRAGRRAIQQVGGHGLVLDDFLAQVEYARQSFKLQRPNFGLKEVESYPGSAPAVGRFVRDTLGWHHGEVCAKPHPLLDELGTKIYGAPINTAVYSGRTLSPALVGYVLRRVLELGLQTIVQLPPKDPRPEYSPKTILSLASALVKYGAKVGTALRETELRERIGFILVEDHATRNRLMQIEAEMQWAGKTLQAIVESKLKRLRLGSPNPQVRFALYLAGWIQACTGRPRYDLLEMLLDASFDSAGKAVPKWVGRLDVEMHLQRNQRKRWIRKISS
jgi:hypothetical protein